MPLTKIAGPLYLISLGFVNVFIVDHNGLTLIDSGIPGSESKIFSALKESGKSPSDIKQILITHLHTDHVGSLKAVKQACGASTYAHSADASGIRSGQLNRSVRPAPGLIPALLSAMIRRQNKNTQSEPVEIEHDLQDGQILDFAANAVVVHTPGHSAGHVAYFWPQQGGILVAGDVLTHWFNVGHPPIYEDFEMAKTSLRRISTLKFDTICFSHGKPIYGNASQLIQGKITAMIKQLN
jgi:glyoxylase-like metal-dependent hydrolase (beta-lactamase superfamily II)